VQVYKKISSKRDFLVDPQGRESKDLEILEKYLQREHSYFSEGVIGRGADDFPLGRLYIEENGLRLRGFNLISISNPDISHVSFAKETLRNLHDVYQETDGLFRKVLDIIFKDSNLDDFFDKKYFQELVVQKDKPFDEKFFYCWSLKDCSSLTELFTKNFTTIINNKIIKNPEF